jgi:hypothetical protein
MLLLLEGVSGIVVAGRRWLAPVGRLNLIFLIAAWH